MYKLDLALNNLQGLICHKIQATLNRGRKNNGKEIACLILRDNGHYIHIVIHRQICFILSELISVARHARFLKLGSKPGWLKRQSKTLPLSHEETSSSEVNFKRLWITFTIVYIHPLNGYRELNSYEEPCNISEWQCNYFIL